MVFHNVPLHELSLLPTRERNLRVSNLRVNSSALVMSPLSSPTEIAIAVQIPDVVGSPFSGVVGRIERTFNVHVQELERTGSSVEGDSNFSALLTFSGYLSGFEQQPGRRTRLRVTVANLPSGTRVYASTEELKSVPARLSAYLTRTNAVASGPFERVEPVRSLRFQNRSVPIGEVPLESGFSTIAWELEYEGACEAQSITVGLRVETPEPASAIAWASLAPISLVTTASSVAPVPRFVDTALPINIPCLATRSLSE